MHDPITSVIRGETDDIVSFFDTLPKDVRCHSESVASLSELLLSWALADLPDEFERCPSLSCIRRAVLYHDVGLALIPSRLQEKEGDLTGAEYRVIQRHVLYGSHLLDNYRKAHAATPQEDSFWALATEIALSHHERWDGKGYPFEQLTTATPIIVRAVSIADAFDSIVRGAKYRMALPPEYAVLEIIQNAGRQFDPQLAAIFRNHCDDVITGFSY